jgi:hypothetical protein
MRAPQCFVCKKFAKLEECSLLRNKKSRNRRWVHYTELTEINWDYWEEVDRSLGECTDGTG